MSLKIIHEDCSVELANDKSFPCTTFLVEYYVDGEIHYDLVITDKRTEIFDYYWDLYRSDLLTFKQTEGRANPKQWTPSEKPKRTKK